MTPQEWKQANRKLLRYEDPAGDAKEYHDAVEAFQHRQAQAHDPKMKVVSGPRSHKAKGRLVMERRGRHNPDWLLPGRGCDDEDEPMTKPYLQLSNESEQQKQGKTRRTWRT